MINDMIVGIMANQSICTEYQPIISVADRSVYAYEALARFRVNGSCIPPNEIFRLCHEDRDVLFLLEGMVKRKQLQHRPKGKKLFLNLDPDSFVKDTYKKFWVTLLSSAEDIVVEIIENSDEENVKEIEAFIVFLQKERILFAIDDFGKDDSLYSSKILTQAPVIKFDRGFVSNIWENPAFEAILKGFVTFAQSSAKVTVLEGIESEEDLAIAKRLGILYVQGYLFREQFIQGGAFCDVCTLDLPTVPHHLIEKPSLELLACAATAQ